MDRQGDSPLPGIPDPDLHFIRRFKGGDERAFDELVTRYHSMVYRMLRSLVGHHEDADDLAQEVFLRAYRSLRKFEERSSFKTWLTRITINSAIRHRSSWWVRNRNLPPGEVSALDLIPAPQPGGGALGTLLREEERRRLRVSIDRLPLRQRETVLQVLRGDRTYAEIAREMGCTEGTVKANFFHALQKLRGALFGSGAGRLEPER